MNVAFIPVRGGSKSIPFKNIKEINGKPLVYWVCKAANDCKYIDKIYVATDSKEIRNVIKTFDLDKVVLIGRSKESATDTASTESAMVEFANKHEFENIVLIQATSPLLTTSDLNNGFKEFRKKEVDSVLSVVKQKRFNWKIDNNGFAIPTNYDYINRPRRQEFDGYYVENGAFYITSRKSLIKSKNRISGRIRLVEMDERSYLEIDEPSDWDIIENILKSRHHKESGKIKMLLTDCDGCLTDGGMYYSEKGDELKKFNTRDGMGFGMLRKLNILTGIVTSESVKLNKRRAEKIKADIYKFGIKNKLETIKKIAKKQNIKLSEIAYFGDDLNDLETLKKTGISACPKDAIKVIRECVDYVCIKKGGEGAVREFIDWLIENDLLSNSK